MKLVLAVLALGLLLQVGCMMKETVQPPANNQTPPTPISEANNPITPTSFEVAKAKAEAGDADAQYRLGWKYRIGEGVLKDSKEAFKW